MKKHNDKTTRKQYRYYEKNKEEEKKQYWHNDEHEKKQDWHNAKVNGVITVWAPKSILKSTKMRQQRNNERPRKQQNKVRFNNTINMRYMYIEPNHGYAVIEKGVAVWENNKNTQSRKTTRNDHKTMISKDNTENKRPSTYKHNHIKTYNTEWTRPQNTEKQEATTELSTERGNEDTTWGDLNQDTNNNNPQLNHNKDKSTRKREIKKHK